MIDRFLKPHYLYSPRQAGRRLLRALTGSLPASMIVTMPWGLPLRIDATDASGLSIWHLGVHDLAVSETLWRLLERGALALDVGANIGQMTSIMALRTGASGRVLAFEPHPDVFRQLVENIALFSGRGSLAAVVPHSSAMGDAPGMSYLECPDSFAKNRGTARLTTRKTPISVKVTTLDDILLDLTASVVKIDVEGSELQVLQGGTKALEDGRIRSLVYEGHPRARRSLAGFLERFGYRVYGLGWNLHGLVLSGPAAAPRLPGFQPPNFLATLDPESLIPRLERRGWEVLRTRSARLGAASCRPVDGLVPGEDRGGHCGDWPAASALGFQFEAPAQILPLASPLPQPGERGEPR